MKICKFCWCVLENCENCVENLILYLKCQQKFLLKKIIFVVKKLKIDRKIVFRFVFNQSSDFRISNFEFWFSNFAFRILLFEFRILVFEFSFSNFHFRILIFEFRLCFSNFEFCVSNFEFWFSNFDFAFRISTLVFEFRLCFSNFAFPISNFYFRISIRNLKNQKTINFLRLVIFCHFYIVY